MSTLLVYYKYYTTLLYACRPSKIVVLLACLSDVNENSIISTAQLSAEKNYKVARNCILSIM